MRKSGAAGGKKLVPEPIVLAREWIVAAGIEDDHLDLRFRTHLLQHIVQLDCLNLDVRRIFQRGIDGDQEIFAADLKAVAGIVDDSHIRAVHGGKIVAELIFKLQLCKIARDENIKTSRSKRVGHVHHILGRVLEGRDFLVIGVADYKGDPSFDCRSIESRDACEHQGRNESATSEHGKSLNRHYLATTRTQLAVPRSVREHAICRDRKERKAVATAVYSSLDRSLNYIRARVSAMIVKRFLNYLPVVDLAPLGPGAAGIPLTCARITRQGA